MRKKPVYKVKLKRGWMTYEMELQYHYEKTKGWVFTYDGLEIASAWGRAVSYRDDLFESVSQNIQGYFNLELIEKLKAIHTIPPRNKQFDHNTDDEIWFAIGAKAFSDYRNGIDSGDIKIGKILIPEWIQPATSHQSTGFKLNTYIALKRFLRHPKQRKKMKIESISTKFGI